MQDVLRRRKEVRNMRYQLIRKVDMTEGGITQAVLLFALPIVIGNLLQQLYTTVDTLVLGNHCGKEALAAIGTSAQPVELVLCFFLGMGTGVSILVSQSFGQGDTGKLKTLCRSAVFFVWLCGVPLALLGYLAAPWILRYMQVPDDAFEQAVIYTRIVLFGSLGNIGYNMNAGILRGMGDSAASLRFLLIACVINILLDLVTVAWLGMGVAGAALATTTAVYVSWHASIRYLKRSFPELDFRCFTCKASREELKNIARIGLPIGLNNSLYSFGHLAMQSLVNSQGSTFMAGQAVAGRINSMANLSVSALSSAATTFSGQCYGAGKMDRFRLGAVRIPMVSGGVTLFCGLVCIALRRPLLAMFTSDEEILLYASRYVVVLLLSHWMYAVFSALMCMVNGVGLIRFTTLISLLMLWAVRIPSAYLIAEHFDGTWVMLCFPISFAFGMIGMILYTLLSPMWKRKMNCSSRRTA